MNRTILHQSPETLHRYRELCRIEPSIPLFSRDWWLDAVCGEENWGVVFVENNNTIIGTLPYYLVEKKGQRVITMPPLTQTMGPWLRYPPDQKYMSRLSFEKRTITTMIDQLPEVDAFRQNFHHSVTNWLPFFWKSYRQSTRYTYILDDLRSLSRVWAGMGSNIRGDIRKAANRFKVNVTNECSINEFLKINTLTFSRQNMKLPYDKNTVERVFKTCNAHHRGKVFIARDPDNQIHAAIYIIWDNQTAYLLMAGGDPNLRNSGATSLLVWEAIQFASTVTEQFDFEGSMLEPVERFFRSFGARQQPYHAVYKGNPKLLPV